MQSSIECPHSPREYKIEILTLVIIVGMTTAALFHYICGFYLRMPFPYFTFLQHPKAAFSDFFDVIQPMQKGDPYGNGRLPYLPFSFVPFYPLVYLPNLVAYGIVVLVYLSTAFFFIVKTLSNTPLTTKWRVAFLLGVMSYPALFSLDRGNIEIYLWVFLALFTYFYIQNNLVVSAVFLSLAIAMKGYPLLFSVLFLNKKDWRLCLFSVLAPFVINVVTANFMPGGVLTTFIHWKAGFSWVTSAYALSDSDPVMPFTSSIFNAIKVLFISFRPIDHNFVLSLNHYYVAFCLLSAVFVLLYIKYSDLMKWEIFSLIVSMMILFPQVSFDYKLPHIIFPFILFILENNATPSRRSDTLFTVLFSLMFVPKAFFMILGYVSIGVIINPLILISICALIIARNPPQWFNGRKNSKNIELSGAQAA